MKKHKHMTIDIYSYGKRMAIMYAQPKTHRYSNIMDTKFNIYIQVKAITWDETFKKYKVEAVVSPKNCSLGHCLNPLCNKSVSLVSLDMAPILRKSCPNQHQLANIFWPVHTYKIYYMESNMQSSKQIALVQFSIENKNQQIPINHLLLGCFTGINSSNFVISGSICEEEKMSKRQFVKMRSHGGLLLLQILLHKRLHLDKNESDFDYLKRK